MAQAKTVKGSQLLILVGDGGSPETFAHPCLINSSRGIQFSAETNSANVPDCDDPDAIQWTEVDKKSLSAGVTGAGTLNATDSETFFDWFKSADTKTVRVKKNVTGANGGGYWEGEFHLTQYEENGNIGEKVQCSITLVSSGAITWTDNA
ncbi:MAG TPA: phage tail tube protein [Caulobacterales bacterium]|nr:phage tail tube protein [Caulobacterales bacterium]